MSVRFEISIFAYVLMGNHYHLLLRTNKANLSKSMQWLRTTYSRRFNLRHFRSGHLSQGRFKNILVQNDAYFTQLSCYIHRNPLRDGLVDRLADYHWSSYRAYAYSRKPPSWLDTQFILSLKVDGQPLSKSERYYFEPRFGVDFSQVRLHSDAQATESARPVNAKAYTLGQDVVFETGQYTPGTSEG